MEYKATGSYRMSRQAKQMLSRILDPHERGEIKKTVVQSELHLQLVPKRNPLEKDRNSRSNTKTATDISGEDLE